MDEHRTQPQSPDVERAILGAMLLTPDAIGTAIELTSIESFFKPTYQILFRVLSDMYEADIPVDQLSVVERLEKDGMLENIGGEATIAALMRETASAANIEYHCKIIEDKALYRKIIMVAGSHIQECYNGKTSAVSVMEDLQNQLSGVAENSVKKKYTNMMDVTLRSSAEIQHRYSIETEYAGIPCGIKRIDRIIDGWQPGKLITIAGRPGQGKSALALEFARYAAKHGEPVGLLSLEMGDTELGMRLIATESGIETSNVRNIKVNNDDWMSIHNAETRISSYPIYIDDSGGLTLMRAVAKIRRLIKERGIKIAIIDYLQLMSGSGEESRRAEISAITRGLKAYSKILKIPIIILSQLTRSGDKIPQRPRLDLLKESGSIEEDSDIVMFIWDPPVSDKNQNIAPPDGEPTLTTDYENIREIYIAKNRGGPVGIVYVSWVGKYTRFGELNYKWSGD